jgi:hypothetical protein
MGTIRARKALTVEQADELVVRLEQRLNLFAKLLFDNGAGDHSGTLTGDEEIALAGYLEELRDDARTVHEALVAADPMVPPDGATVARLHALCRPATDAGKAGA